MGRLTQTSDKGGVAFTFDLDITCRSSEAQKILKLAEKLKAYEDINDDPEKLKLIDALYLERCEEINRLNKIIKVLATKLLNTEFGGCYMCKNPMKNITIDGVNNGCNGECNTTEKSSVEDFLKKFIAELERMKEVQDVN